jgi:hypothetical protein
MTTQLLCDRPSRFWTTYDAARVIYLPRSKPTRCSDFHCPESQRFRGRHPDRTFASPGCDKQAAIASKAHNPQHGGRRRTSSLQRSAPPLPLSGSPQLSYGLHSACALTCRDASILLPCLHFPATAALAATAPSFPFPPFPSPLHPRLFPNISSPLPSAPARDLFVPLLSAAHGQRHPRHPGLGAAPADRSRVSGS